MGESAADSIERSRPMAKYDEWLTPDGLLQLEAWARDGLTYEQIASNCGIALSTLKDWRKRFSAISTALKKGKAVVDIMVENALYKRAMGYTFEEVVHERTCVGKDDDGLPIYEMVETKRATKEVQPDVTAQIFWLKNRKPKEWRDKQEVEHSGDLGVVIVDDIPKG
jgi:hypothetical protein